MDKIKITQKEFDELYEVEENLTQPIIEDNINKGLDKPEQEMFTEEEIEQDRILKENL